MLNSFQHLKSKETLKQVQGDDGGLEAKLKALAKAGLIDARQVECDKHPEWHSAYELHRLTKLVMGEKKQTEAMVLVADGFPHDSDNSHYWAICRLLVPHAEIFKGVIKNISNEADSSYLLFKIALFEDHANSNYEKAKDLLLLCLQILESLTLENEQKIVMTISVLGRVLEKIGGDENLLQAEKCFRRALTITKKNKNKLRIVANFTENGLQFSMKEQEKREIIVCLSNLAHILMERNKLIEAKKIATQAYKLDFKISSFSYELTIRLNVLAQILEKEGGDENYIQAENFKRKSLLMTREFCKNSPELLHIPMINLATNLHFQCKLFEARELLNEAIELQTKVYPPTHHYLLSSRESLANINAAIAAGEGR